MRKKKGTNVCFYLCVSTSLGIRGCDVLYSLSDRKCVSCSFEVLHDRHVIVLPLSLCMGPTHLQAGVLRRCVCIISKLECDVHANVNHTLVLKNHCSYLISVIFVSPCVRERSRKPMNP